MNAKQIVNDLLTKTGEMRLPWKPLQLYNEQNTSILKLKERCGKSAYYTNYENSVDCICCVFTIGIVYKEYFLFIYNKERLAFKTRSNNDETSRIKDLFIEAGKTASSSAWIIKIIEQTERLQKSLEAVQKIKSDIMRMYNSTIFDSITEVNNAYSSSTKECDSVTEDMPGNSAFYAVENLATVMKDMKPFIEEQSKLIKQLDPVFRNAKVFENAAKLGKNFKAQGWATDIAKQNKNLDILVNPISPENKSRNTPAPPPAEDPEE